MSRGLGDVYKRQQGGCLKKGFHAAVTRPGHCLLEALSYGDCSFPRSSCISEQGSPFLLFSVSSTLADLIWGDITILASTLLLSLPLLWPLHFGQVIFFTHFSLPVQFPKSTSNFAIGPDCFPAESGIQSSTLWSPPLLTTTYSSYSWPPPSQ